ncbi:MAG: glycerophosphodiester phosphodiesterase family protein [Candidatus Aureabacteria bacterium]|nr:glycerophosphodiester phosphodiesterase family protein [Candidatus Auribacterota bacterium]
MSKQRLVWALGGESLCAPEDTFPAYWAALGAGADGLVINVQLTLDQVPVCCRHETLEATCGDPRKVNKITAEELRKLDAGAQFRSNELDENNQPIGQGDDTPWEGPKHKQVPLYHPTLEEVLRVFGRRTCLILVLDEPSSANSIEFSDWDVLGDTVGRLLSRFSLTKSVIVTGHAASEVQKRAPGIPQAYWHTTGVLTDPVPLIEKTRKRDCYLILDGRFCEDGKLRPTIEKALHRAAPVLIASIWPFTISPAAHERLAKKKWLAGYVCRGVLPTAEMLRPRGLVIEDDFAGIQVTRDLWIMGSAKANQDARIHQNDGLIIQIRKGGQYSSAAALTSCPIHGDFDAQVDFEVKSPQQGTTFELAAIQIDPGYRSINLTFDVHGAPPYASSERDEDNGFRIGWNNGPAVTEFEKHTPQSSNIYNQYSRDVGDGSKSNPTGRLRLVRRGEVFNAYYTDKHNRQWVLSGTALIPTLAKDVFLRLAAKHWPKSGRTPPPNRVRFSKFRVYQH